MAVQPNTTGYLSRSTNPPANAAGWALCFWFRRTGSVGTGVTETLFEITDNASGDYLRAYVTDTGALFWEASGVVYENVSIFTTTLNQWYFVCFRTASATTGDILYRADNATTMSASSARAFETDPGWDVVTFMDNNGHLEPCLHFEFMALKMFIGSLTDAQVWEQSIRMLPRCAPSILDSYVPLYTTSGVDEGGRARDWTVSGTLAEAKSQPRIARGGTSRARIISPAAIAAIQAPLATATGSAPALTALATQPASLPLSAAVATALALSALSVQPVTLPLATGAAAALAITAGSNVTLPLASGSAQAPALSALAVQPVTLALTAGSGSAPALSALSSQPVTLPVAGAAGAAPTLQLPAVVTLPRAAATGTGLDFRAGTITSIQLTRTARRARRALGRR